MSRALRSLTTAILLAAAGALPAAAADVAEEILAKGIEAYHAGKLEPAIGGINAALRARLPAVQVARAHYYRGLAYRKQGNPGRAITDLTRALDDPGLTDAERSDAMEARSAAYQEAGIADEETVVVATDSGERVKPAHAAQPARVEAPRSAAAASAWTTASTSTSIAAPPAAQAAVPKWDGATQVAIAAPLVPAVPALTASAPAPDKREPAAALTAADRPATSKWSGGTRIAVATPKVPAPASPSATKTTVQATPNKWAAKQIAMAPLPPVPVHKTSAQPTASDWSASAQVAVAAPPPAKPIVSPAKPLAPFVTQVAAVMPAAPPAPPPVAPRATPPAAPAEVRLLVGEARTRSEAFALAIRLTSQRGAELGPRKPQIAETTVVGAGLVYRVRLGPFADAGQAQALCQSLRGSGYPCVVE